MAGFVVLLLVVVFSGLASQLLGAECPPAFNDGKAVWMESLTTSACVGHIRMVIPKFNLRDSIRIKLHTPNCTNAIKKSSYLIYVDNIDFLFSMKQVDNDYSKCMYDVVTGGGAPFRTNTPEVRVNAKNEVYVYENVDGELIETLLATSENGFFVEPWDKHSVVSVTVRQSAGSDNLYKLSFTSSRGRAFLFTNQWARTQIAGFQGENFVGEFSKGWAGLSFMSACMSGCMIGMTIVLMAYRCLLDYPTPDLNPSASFRQRKGLPEPESRDRSVDVEPIERGDPNQDSGIYDSEVRPSPAEPVSIFSMIMRASARQSVKHAPGQPVSAQTAMAYCRASNKTEDPPTAVPVNRPGSIQFDES